MSDKIAVLLGGKSSERQVSLLSGKSIVTALQAYGMSAYAIDIKYYPIINLKKDGFKKVFLALHGRGGEDGIIQSVLEFLKIPYTGSGIQASAISINKLSTKLIWKNYGLPVSPWITVTKSSLINGSLTNSIKQQIVNLSMPVIVKPITEGSSIGITKVNHLNEISLALKKAFYYDNTILVEKWISGPEYTVVIIGDQILPEIRIKSSGIYDYNEKYFTLSKTKYFCPSGLSIQQQWNLNNLVMKAWQVIGCSGCGRIDVIKQNDKFYLLEINTCPGMTSTSLVPIAAQQIGWTFSKLVIEILNLADLKNNLF
ncbi:MAG: D-alanine--D-alanine ligase [Candidatus Dasytiphilus stammeri]